MTLETPGSRSCLGLDLGQARDYSAIAIAERRVELTGTHDSVTFVQHTRTRVLINHLERIPLRTPYPDVVARVRAIVQQFHPPGKLQVVMDATGVGAAVRDMLTRANPRRPPDRRYAHRRRTRQCLARRLSRAPARLTRQPPCPARKTDARHRG